MYRMEYGRLPLLVGLTADVTTETKADFLAVLMGDDRHGLNPRQKVFYEGHGVRSDPVTGDPELLDSQGRCFVVILDGDEDGEVLLPNGRGAVRKGCAVFGLGEDADDPWDDVRSW